MIRAITGRSSPSLPDSSTGYVLRGSDGGLRPALEPLLQLLLIPRDLLLRLPPHNERHEQLADAMTLEVEFDGHT
jgi:hypothetical protein